MNHSAPAPGRCASTGCARPPLGRALLLHPRLVAAASRRWDVAPERILVSAGATGGLSAAAGALLALDDEVLILAPYWPLIPGIVSTRGGRPVAVPYYDRPGSVAERLAPYLTERTVALYLNTPSNPTGQVLPAAELAPRILEEQHRRCGSKGHLPEGACVAPRVDGLGLRGQGCADAWLPVAVPETLHPQVHHRLEAGEPSVLPG